MEEDLWNWFFYLGGVCVGIIVSIIVFYTLNYSGG